MPSDHAPAAADTPTPPHARAHHLVVAFAAACAGDPAASDAARPPPPVEATPVTAPAMPTPASTTPPPASPPPCGPTAAPALDYRHLEIGAAYHVVVVQSGDEWLPADSVPMPMHHATRIEWQNPGVITALGPAASGRLRFTFTVDARDIRQVPDRRAWRVTVRATITDICAPAP